MVEPAAKLDPDSLVARIIEELQASPKARVLLLRAMLTNEFLGKPLGFKRVKADVAEMRIDIAATKAYMSQRPSLTCQ